jgi:hypothetical protein
MYLIIKKLSNFNISLLRSNRLIIRILISLVLLLRPFKTNLRILKSKSNISFKLYINTLSRLLANYRKGRIIILRYIKPNLIKYNKTLKCPKDRRK